MMTYLLKFLLVSMLLYGFYHLLLSNEVTLKFNRFFLLAILVIAALIPVTVTSIKVIPEVSQGPEMKELLPSDVLPTLQKSVEVSSTWYNEQSLLQVLFMLYLAISAVFIFRYVKNLYRIRQMQKGATVVKHEGLKLVLKDDIAETFSFRNRVYANKTHYEEGLLPEAILEHERAHIRQGHSYDLIIFEFITCFLWFNPVVFLISRAIRLNHEFLADQHAIKHLGSTNQYQNLLIQFASQQHLLKLPLVSQLTFGETKKRLIIMAKQSNRMSKIFKTTGAFILTAALFMALGNEEIVAQQVQSQEAENTNKQVTQDRPPPPPPVFVQLNPQAKVRFTNPEGKLVTSLFKDLSKDEKGQFLAQGQEAEIQLPPPPRAHLTEEMMEDFTDSKKYKVWINGKQVPNSHLSLYKADDFHHFFKTRLSKNAKNYGKYDYQIDMTTIDALADFLKDRWVPFQQRYIPKPAN